MLVLAWRSLTIAMWATEEASVVGSPALAPDAGDVLPPPPTTLSRAQPTEEALELDFGQKRWCPAANSQSTEVRFG